MMTTILRVMCVFILVTLVVSCASNKDVKEIKSLIAEGNAESYQLRNRMDLLYGEIDDDRIRLDSLEDNGKGFSYAAISLKNKINKNKALINSLNHELNNIRGDVQSNSNEIETIKTEQQNKKRAIQEALLNNDKTKRATSERITELEKEYEEKRKYKAQRWETEK